MDFEKLKTQKFSFKPGSNIDPRYFVENDDGSYTPTDLFAYTVAMSIRDKAKDAIFKMDTARKYTNESDEKTRPDAWEVKQHELAYKAENAALLEKKEAEWRQYVKDHDDEFEDVPSFPTGNEDQNRYLAHCRPNIEFTSLEDAFGHFLAANSFCAKYGKADPERFVVGTPAPASVEPMIKHVSKADFKEAHAKVKADLDAKYHIPEDDTKAWKASADCPQETYTTISFSRKKDVTQEILSKQLNTDHVEEFVNVLADNLVGSTPEAYKQELYAKLTGGELTRSFIAAFNEVRMPLLTNDADGFECEDGSIAWRLRADDEVNPMEILVRAKSPETKIVQTIIAVRKTNSEATPYTFSFTINLEDGQSVAFNVYISSQSDLEKALNKCLVLIDDTPFEKYKEALQDAYDNYKNSGK